MKNNPLPRIDTNPSVREQLLPFAAWSEVAFGKTANEGTAWPASTPPTRLRCASSWATDVRDWPCMIRRTISWPFRRAASEMPLADFMVMMRELPFQARSAAREAR